MKKNIYSLLVLFIFSILSIDSYSQNLKPISTSSNKVVNHEFCASDFFHEEKMKTDLGYRERYLQIKEQISQIQTQKNPVNGIYQVPVVVHVMHKGESVGTGTNISDADVKLGIQYLNNFWRKVASSVGDGDGVDMQIEFTLAIQDEGGNCTDGIDRVDMSGVTEYVNNGVKRSSAGIADYNGDAAVNSLKEYSIWDPTEFYNVWLVDEIDNANCYSGGSYTAGYAYYSSAHGQAYDGSVVLICSYLDDSDVTWAHEMGHAFNLPHTFDGDNDGANCGDDGITDTPAHKRTSSFDPSIYFDCTNTDANSCDASFNQEINPETGFRRNTGTHQDHMHNYMDYTGCATEFTGGQRTVAIAAMTGSRGSFLSGYALTPPLPASVDFTASGTAACQGSSLTFTDQSTCTPNTYTNTGYTGISFSWTFDNGVDAPYTSTDQNPTITFNNSGTYNVTLEITNPNGTTSSTKTDYITIAGSVQAACSPTSSNEGNYWQTIYGVSFNDMSNSTSQYVNTAYTDFSCTKTTTVTAGETYPLSVSANAEGGSGNEVFEVYIDYNNNGDFTDSGELVFSGSSSSGSKNTYNQNVVIPGTAVTNTILRMRVIGETGTITAAERTCSSSLLVGDIEDYGVLIQSAAVTPVAAFSADQTTVCEGTTINFTDESTNIPNGWTWNFGGGAINSTSQNPSVAFNTPGTYTITLTATNGGGGDDEVKTNYITVNPAPSITIHPNDSTINEGENASFSVTASNATAYQWQVNTGGGFSNISNGGVYSNATTSTLNITGATVSMDSYLYQCVVTGNCTPNATSNSATLTVNGVCNDPDVPTISGTTTICNGNSTLLSVNTGSLNDASGWEWYTGSCGGTPLNSGASVNVAPSSTTTYYVRGEGGCVTPGACATITVNVNDNPDLSVTSSTDETCTGNDGTASVSLGVGTYTYSWNTAPVQTTSTATGLAAATYNVTVTNTSTTCFASTNVVVSDGCVGSAPIADFTASATTICEGESLDFTDLSTNTPTGWSWDFGDGGTSTAQNPSHVYDAAGTYTVTLTATNGIGSDVEVKSNHITVNTCGTTKLRDIDCGITLPNYTTYITCDYVVGATQYEYEITNGGLGYSQTVIRNSNYRFIYIGTITGVLSNTTYDIRVRAKVGGSFGSYGATCQVTTPINNLSIQLMSNYCDYTLSSYSELIKCDYIEGATEYEYEITNGGLGFSQTVLKPSAYRFLYLSQVAGISDGVTYDVRVRAKINGVFTNYGTSCQVTTPTGLTTKLRDIDCGKNLPDSATYITCDYIAGATQYQYEIVNAISSFIDSITRPSNYRFIYLNSVSGVQYNRTYDIRVRAYVNNSWTDFGSICEVTTPASAIVSGDAVSRLVNKNEVENIPTTLTIYPNPNQGEYLFVELADLAPNSELVVTDIYGKQIERMILNTEDSNYNTTVKFTNKLTSGFYLITVHSNRQSITKKLIVR